MKYYAGIGNRHNVPSHVYDLIKEVATVLSTQGYTLRSGGAIGCDKAFENSSLKSEIFKVNHATNDAIEIAAKFHPHWENCSDYVKKLHGRNSMIILGENLNNNVDFVLCFTVDEKNGGTALGIKIAKANNIPVYNLATDEGIIFVKELIHCANTGVEFNRLPLI